MMTRELGLVEGGDTTLHWLVGCEDRTWAASTCLVQRRWKLEEACGWVGEYGCGTRDRGLGIDFPHPCAFASFDQESMLAESAGMSYSSIVAPKLSGPETEVLKINEARWVGLTGAQGFPSKDFADHFFGFFRACK